MGKKEKRERKEREDQHMLRNGGLLLAKRISYFDCKYSNPFRSFTAEELQKATDNYHPSLFSGFGDSYVVWYKGCLEGRVIFVKKYDGHKFKIGAYPEFVSNGIAVAAQVSGHKNALKLLGCCLETPIPTPVFEFPENGNLCDQLITSNPTCLSWRIRLKIANEMASVITYLHTKFPRPIIHRDLRPQHFYLDQDFTAKLSDFMNCMTIPEGETQVQNERLMGFYGYFAPEVAASGVFSEKSDVFGFGSLLLCLLSGKRCSGLSESLPSFDCGSSDIRNHRINKIFDHKILAEEGVHHHHQFKEVYQLALQCRRNNAEDRPIMLDVARRLTRIQRNFISNEANLNDTSSSNNLGYMC